MSSVNPNIPVGPGRAQQGKPPEKSRQTCAGHTISFQQRGITGRMKSVRHCIQNAKEEMKKLQDQPHQQQIIALEGLHKDVTSHIGEIKNKIENQSRVKRTFLRQQRTLTRLEKFQDEVTQQLKAAKTAQSQPRTAVNRPLPTPPPRRSPTTARSLPPIPQRGAGNADIKTVDQVVNRQLFILNETKRNLSEQAESPHLSEARIAKEDIAGLCSEVEAQLSKLSGDLSRLGNSGETAEIKKKIADSYTLLQELRNYT